MTLPKQRTAALIIIGNEILSGRTQDKNLAYVATFLNQHGIRLMESRMILDDFDEIIEAVNTLRKRYDFVITTGGIGPTHDDITPEAIARAFGVPYEYHPESVIELKKHYTPEMLNEARMKMAKMPRGARLIRTPLSGAPAFAYENVYILAGVPKIMQSMLDSVKEEFGSGPSLLSRSITCLLPEGNVAEGLTKIQENHPHLEIGSYPFSREGIWGTVLVTRGFSYPEIDKACDEIKTMVTSLGGQLIEEQNIHENCPYH
ncbi:Competence/damage-inducible protein A [Candidatus Bealeia paramacronuclearis]|uniref:Competence/damage-inducible protein A n=1 Tax=Candidatus Bealeia paramacronuclearis TaxID=1921001 RepID=A0ABZ2C311_9PROT|nr:Competence/damage-inducible protein A [Candidatus Bealeia paramacronuclearis]